MVSTTEDGAVISSKRTVIWDHQFQHLNVFKDAKARVVNFNLTNLREVTKDLIDPG